MKIFRPCHAALLLAGCVLPAAAQQRILPAPVVEQAGSGRWTLLASTPIVVPRGDVGAKAAAERLIELVYRSRGLRLATTDKSAAQAIRFRRVSAIAREGYRLDLNEKGAVISATDDAGLFYGAVSLWQVLTPGVDAVASVRVEDRPRYRWRGLMLDSARHFQSPAFIRQLIDWMAAHKLNRLHWHLVDDQGWRIEIRKYPRLTEVGAWRTPAAAPGAPPLPRIGGFYTQEQIREIVSYAAARHVMIVPEIEMPGHALSAIRAYPELGTGAPIPAGIESDWGVFPWLYNVSDPTFSFLEDVLDEVMSLFPSPYIHIGGDEAVKDQWTASPTIKARVKALGLKDEHALQSWFIARIGRFLNRRGRKLIGWDEILDGGIAPNATVMSWRGITGAVTAAKAGHDVILSPAPDLYLDHVQSDGAGEPPGRGGVVTLGSLYAFDPEPNSIPPAQRRHILGLQGNLWTEHVRTEARAAYLAFPRMSALAEVAWSGQKGDAIGAFVDRLIPQLDRLKPFGLVPAHSAFVPVSSVEAGVRGARVSLSNQIGAEMRFTLDGTPPSASSQLYGEPLNLSLPARLRATSFRNGKALPGALDASYDATSISQRKSAELKLCSNKIALRLEDDAPAAGPRAAVTVDIMNPCWIYERAALDGKAAIMLDVAQLPFNFQIGADREKIVFRPPATPEGEMEIRLDGCDGERIAVLPLAAAARIAAVTRLEAPIGRRTGVHDLCITYSAQAVNPLWAIDAVQLVAKP